MWEKVVCDSLGDMNIFHDIPVMEEHAQELLDETKKAAALEETLDSEATAREMVRAVQPILKIRLARMQSGKE